MKYPELKRKIAEKVDPSMLGYIISFVGDGKPIPTGICISQRNDGSFMVTRGDLRTIADAVLDDAGQVKTFASEDAVCDWVWNDIGSTIGEKVQYTEEKQRQFKESGDRQRERFDRAMAQHKKDSE